MQSAFSPALAQWVFFEREKKWIPDSKHFTFFMPKNDLFFDFWTPLIFGPKARKKFGPFFFSGFGGGGTPRGVTPHGILGGAGTPVPPKSASGLHTPMVP